MLRTMITEAPFEQKWVLQGRLAAKWAADLKERWEETRNKRAGRNVSSISKTSSWSTTLARPRFFEMTTEGARLIASRAYMKSILEGLARDGRAVKER